MTSHGVRSWSWSSASIIEEAAAGLASGGVARAGSCFVIMIFFIKCRSRQRFNGFLGLISRGAHKTSPHPARINLARGERERGEGERRRRRGGEGEEREMRLFVSRLFQYYSVINSERTRPGLNRRKLQIPGSERSGEGEEVGRQIT